MRSVEVNFLSLSPCRCSLSLSLSRQRYRWLAWMGWPLGSSSELVSRRSTPLPSWMAQESGRTSWRVQKRNSAESRGQHNLLSHNCLLRWPAQSGRSNSAFRALTFPLVRWRNHTNKRLLIAHFPLNRRLHYSRSSGRSPLACLLDTTRWPAPSSARELIERCVSSDGRDRCQLALADNDGTRQTN